MSTAHVTPELARQADAACVFTNLNAVAESATALFDKALAPAGLSVEQLGYLVCIHGLPGLSIETLASRKCKDPMRLRGELLRMEARGWVRPLGSDVDTLHLNPAGEAKLDEGAVLWAEVQERLVETLGGPAAWAETLEQLSLLQACILGSR